MATAPLIHPATYTENARSYVESLLAEKPLYPRPECGHWEAFVSPIEKGYNNYDPKQGESRPAYLLRLMRTIRNMKTYDKWPLETIYPSSLAPREVRGLGEPALSLVEPGSDSLLGVPPLPANTQLPPAMQALVSLACPWLGQYKVYSQKASPEGFADYHEDCGLFALAAISGRRVKISLGTPQYTPLSIVLTGEPGTYKKSTTAEVAINVLKAAGLGFLLGSDETTPQKLLSDMTGQFVPKNYTHWPEEKKIALKQSKAMAAQVAWYCEEFGELVKSINKSTGPMSDLKKLILKFDNCPADYKVSTITRGQEIIEKPFLSFLGDMTPTSIRQSAKSGSNEWGEGFWSRFVFSCAPDDDGLDCPFGEESPVPWNVSQPLMQYHARLGMPQIEINEILDKKGEQVVDYEITTLVPLPEIVMDHKTIEPYWVRYRSALKKMLKAIPKDLRASYERLPMRALRVAALFASFEGLTVIELRHWAKAQEITERWRVNLHAFYAQVNVSSESLDTPNYVRTLEDKILAIAEKCEEQGKEAPNMRNFEQFIKGVDRGRMLMALRSLVSAGLLLPDTNNRTTRYHLAILDDG